MHPEPAAPEPPAATPTPPTVAVPTPTTAAVPEVETAPLLYDGRADTRRVRQRFGTGPAILAAALNGVRDVLEKPREQVPVVQQQAGEPEDLHGDGISIPVAGVPVEERPRARVPELPDLPARPVKGPRRRRRR